jgi:hypothetical protein
VKKSGERKANMLQKSRAYSYYLKIAVGWGYSLAMKTDAVNFYESTRGHMPADITLHCHCRGISYLKNFV